MLTDRVRPQLLFGRNAACVTDRRLWTVFDRHDPPRPIARDPAVHSSSAGQAHGMPDTSGKIAKCRDGAAVGPVPWADPTTENPSYQSGPRSTGTVVSWVRGR